MTINEFNQLYAGKYLRNIKDKVAIGIIGAIPYGLNSCQGDIFYLPLLDTGKLSAPICGSPYIFSFSGHILNYIKNEWEILNED